MLALLIALASWGRDAHPLMPLDFVIGPLGRSPGDACARGRAAGARARLGVAGLPARVPPSCWPARAATGRSASLS